MLIGFHQLYGAFVNERFVGRAHEPAEQAMYFALVSFNESTQLSLPIGGLMSQPYESLNEINTPFAERSR